MYLFEAKFKAPILVYDPDPIKDFLNWRKTESYNKGLELNDWYHWAVAAYPGDCRGNFNIEVKSNR